MHYLPDCFASYTTRLLRGPSSPPSRSRLRARWARILSIRCETRGDCSHSVARTMCFLLHLVIMQTTSGAARESSTACSSGQKPTMNDDDSAHRNVRGRMLALLESSALVVRRARLHICACGRPIIPKTAVVHPKARAGARSTLPRHAKLYQPFPYPPGPPPTPLPCVLSPPLL